MNTRHVSLRNSLQNTPFAVIEFDLDFNILFWSSQAQELFGWTASEVVGRNMLSLRLMYAEDMEQAQQYARQLISGELSTSTRITRHHTKKGDIICCEWYCMLIRNSQGEAQSLFSIVHDLTEPMRTVDELRASEYRYRTLFNHASDGFLVVDYAGNIRDVNEAVCKSTGYSRSELLGMNVTSFVEPGKLQLNPFEFEKILEGVSVKRSREFIFKDGKCIIAETHSKLLPDGKILVIVRDITEQKQAYDQLLHFRTLMDYSNDAIEIIDPVTLRFLDVNYTACKELGYTKEELLGMTVFDIDPNVSRTNYSSERIRKADHRTLESTRMRKDGTCFPVEINFKFVPFEPAYLIVIVRNISERKKAQEKIEKSERQYRSLFDQAMDAIIISDAEGNIQEANAAFCRLCGCTRKELDFRNIWHLLGPADLNSLPLNINRLKKGEHLFEERKLVLSAVNQIDLEVNVKMLFDGRILTVARDVTDRKKADAEIRRSNERFKELSSFLETAREEERTSIARELHDELGQQLTALKLDLAWLQKKRLDLSEVSPKLNEMQSLLDGTMKSVRRISSSLRPDILDDLGLLPALEWQRNDFERRTGITCHLECNIRELQLDRSVNTGIFRIYQEALTNIARHSRATRVWSLLSRTADQELVMIINDNGIGFDKDAALSNRTLGIEGMRERARLIKGDLRIGSLQDAGTAIYVKIPISSNNSNQAA